MKELCPPNCLLIDEGRVKGACADWCINSENRVIEPFLGTFCGEVVVIDGEGKEGYHLQDGGWVMRDAVK